MKNIKGITLVSLVITIVVLLILTSIATYSGINIIKSSKFTAFSTELKIMQTQVNNIYQKYKDNETITIEDTSYYGEGQKDNEESKLTILEIGEEIAGDIKTQADNVFTKLQSDSTTGITTQDGYLYWSKDLIKKLGIEGVEGDFFVNVEKRSVVSYKGFEYDDKTYYTLEQLPNGLYNVDYENKNAGVPTFDVSVEKIGENKWRVSISNIQYNEGYIDKWKVKYKLIDQENWNTSEDYSFTITESGKYTIQLINGNIKSDERKITIKQNSNMAAILPYEYQQVEYIESTGIQYIDTGITPDENYGFYVDTYFDVNIDTSSPSIKILGSSLYNGDCWGGVTLSSYASTSGGQMTWFSDSNQWINPYLVSKTRMQCYFINDLYSTSLESLNISNPKTIYDNICGNIYLFAIHSEDGAYTNTTSRLKIYEYKAYNNLDVIQDLIPCYRKSDNEIGMYDIINDKFYTNKGTGTFEKGNDVKYEAEGILMYCDAQESNIESRTGGTIKIWEDISGNNNDITLNNVKINQDKSLSAIDTTTSAEKDINISGNHTIEVIAKYDTTDIGYLYTLQQDEDNYFYLWNYSDSGATFSYRYSAGEKWDVFDNITDETAIQGKMYSISITFNEEQKVAKIYINGEYKKSVTFNYYKSMDNVKILILNSLLGDKPLTGGSMYSIRVYEQELTEEQIENNYTIDKERYSIV